MRSALAAVLVALAAGVLSAAPATADPAPTARPAEGWSAPLAGDLLVTRPFEPPPHAYGPGHRGADLAGPAGSPVLAAGDGVVVFAGTVAGRPVVSVDHAGGLRTTYEPVEAVVGAGQPLRRGDPLGRLAPGHPGCPAAACLHWGLRRGEAYLDPLLVLRPPRVRLLSNCTRLPRSELRQLPTVAPCQLGVAR
ncbi:M23 family metallopeptidase [Blastococcus sp. TF02A-35]|uniref:M23 family metallopeptidase n=1 Tax=Blastococcus sp. TF02A-35 TaxID=2559612 RepID=UPI0010740DBE|nr:M23 family metallopeptidase [Blastococcus sp. TF02A_35]TFV47164.1 M23 family metallopeptidase [Blastococcus sp. TF02A_35]